jgi:hypothetical protein
MTISTVTPQVQYNGDGSVETFVIPFRYYADAEVIVYLEQTGVSEALQTITTHYTLTGDGTKGHGIVNFVTAPTSSQVVRIFQWLDLKQLTDYVTGGKFPAESHERALDKLCQSIQQVAQRDGGTGFDYDASTASTPGQAVGNLRLTGSSTAGKNVLQIGGSTTEGLELRCVEETLTALAAISTDLTSDIPAGAVPIGGQINIDTLVVAGGTSVKVGIGPTSDPDKYGITGDLLKNTKGDLLSDPAVPTSAEDVQVNMCATGGSLGNTAASAGAVTIRLYYWALNSMDDA